MRFVKEAGCDAVKIEMAGVSGGVADKRESVARARAIVAAGIPVMGHVGLTPQSASALGGYRTQGRTMQQAVQVADDALALQDAGLLRDRVRGRSRRGHRGDHGAHARSR